MILIATVYDLRCCGSNDLFKAQKKCLLHNCQNLSTNKNYGSAAIEIEVSESTL